MEHGQAMHLVEQADLNNIMAVEVQAAMFLTQGTIPIEDSIYKKCVSIIYRFDMQGLKLWKDIEQEHKDR